MNKTKNVILVLSLVMELSLARHYHGHHHAHNGQKAWGDEWADIGDANSHAKAGSNGGGDSYVGAGPGKSVTRARGTHSTYTGSRHKARRDKWRDSWAAKRDNHGNVDAWRSSWNDKNASKTAGRSGSLGNGRSGTDSGERNSDAFGQGKRGSYSKAGMMRKGDAWRRDWARRKRHGSDMAWNKSWRDRDQIRTGGKGYSKGAGYSRTRSRRRGTHQRNRGHWGAKGHSHHNGRRDAWKDKWG